MADFEHESILPSFAGLNTHFAEIGAFQQINGDKGTGKVFDRMFERLSRELPQVRPTLRNG
jgi:hypothetical protein